MKWGEISSEELDEAVMLENALFGEGSTNHFHYSPHLQSNQESSSPHSVPTLPSPSVAAQQLLREQQVLTCLLQSLFDGSIMHGLIGLILCAGC
jgi:hypothetical protein